MDLFSLLKKDHEELKGLLQRLIATPDPQRESVRDLQEALADLLTNHSAMEEQYLYPRMQKVSAVSSLIRHSYEEHKQAARTLQELGRHPMESPQWVELCQELLQALTQHIETEEQSLFPVIQQEVPNAEVNDMYQQMMTYRKEHLMVTEDLPA
jgi:iron-sulfur cluster repair protein YtfE (RIC family)